MLTNKFKKSSFMPCLAFFSNDLPAIILRLSRAFLVKHDLCYASKIFTKTFMGEEGAKWSYVVFVYYATFPGATFNPFPAQACKTPRLASLASQM